MATESKAWKAGTAYVQVVPSLDKFQKLIGEDLRKIDPEVNLNPTIDAEKAKAEAVKAAKAASGAKAEIEAKVKVNQAEADKAIGAFAKSAQRRVAAALGAIPKDAGEEVDKLRKKLEELGKRTIGATFTAEDFEREANKIDRRLAELGKNAKLQLEFDTDSARRALAAWNQQMEAEDAKRTQRAVAEQARASDAATAAEIARAKKAAEEKQRAEQQTANEIRRMLDAELLAREKARRKEIQDYLNDWDAAIREYTLMLQKARDAADKEDYKRTKDTQKQAEEDAKRRAEAEMGAYARTAQQQLDKTLRTLPKIELTINHTEAERELQVVRNELEHLSNKRIGIEIDAGDFEAELTRLQARLEEISRHHTATVQVKADVAAALAQLNAADRAVSKVDGRRATASFDVTGVARAISMLGLLTAALTAAAAAAAPATAAVIGVGVLGGAAAQGLGTLVSAFYGVGDAVKAMRDEQDKAAANTKVSASAQANAAQAIISAQRALEQAQIQADRASIQGAQQVKDARDALAQAQISAAKKIADSERALADARAQAADRAASAERTLAQEQRQAKSAQDDLNRAREAAVERIEDLKLALRDVALDEREAAIQLKYAQQALQKGIEFGITGDELERLKIQADRAQLALDQTREHAGDLTKEMSDFGRTGVDGSREVVAAQERVVAATDAVSRAQADLVKAQVDGQKSVSRAQAELDQSRTEGAREVAQAQERVGRAQQSAAFAQADAARSVEDAQRHLADAYVDAGNKGTASADKVREAMLNLSPAGQLFAVFLAKELIPELLGVRDAIQGALLPKLETSFRNLMSLTPEITSGLRGTAEVIGDLSVRGSQMMSSGPWREDFTRIMNGNNRIMSQFGQAGLDVADAMRSIYVESLPVVNRFADFVQHSAELFDQWIQGIRVSGQLGNWFDVMGDKLAELWGFFTKVFDATVALVGALSPLGDVVIGIVGGFADFVHWLSEASPWLIQIIGSAVLAGSVFITLGRAIGGTAAAFKSSAEVYQKIIDYFAGIAGGGDKAAASTDKAAGSTGKVSGVTSKLGVALPILGVAVVGLGLAFDALTVSSDEATKAMLQGGKTAAAVSEQMKTQDFWVRQARSGWLNFVPLGPIAAAGIGTFVSSSEDARKEMQKQLDAMDPLHRAQAELNIAQNDYSYAVERWTANSPQAIEAHQRFAFWSGESARLQKILDVNLTGVTDKLIAQRTELLSSIDAEIAWKDLLAQATQAIVDHGAGVDLNTEAGRRNMEILQQMANAAIRHLEEMTKQGAGFIELSNKEDYYRDGLIKTAMQFGMNETDARNYVDKLNLIPGNKSTSVDLDTVRADKELTDWFAFWGRKELKVQVEATTGNIMLLRDPGRAAGSVDFITPMAGGGLRRMAAGVSNVIRPGQFTLVGDNRRFNESYIPHDPASARSQQILDVTAAALGRVLLPQGAGLAPAAGMGLDTDATAEGMRTLADSVQNLTQQALAPLGDQLTDTVVPALAVTAHQAGVDTALAFAALQAALPPLDAQATTSSQIMQRSWAADTAAVQGMQRAHNASWQSMTAMSGGSVATITGPQFGALHSGLNGVVQGFDIASGNIGSIWGRLRGYVAEPIRWSLVYPINTGLRNAWGEIDRFFDLRKPWGGVPVTGFAMGTEDHRAQIARAGEWRVWAEDETGGEAYIPLGLSKRRRSTDILDAVAERFGYDLIPNDPRFYADGGLWRQMFAVVKKQFPAATLNSAYRPGDPGYHGSGRATDLGGDLPAINKWLANAFANSTELIYTPGINLWHGQPHTYNAQTRADHFDHVHWALENAGMLGGAPGNYGAGPGGVDVVAWLNEKLAPARQMIADINRFHGVGNIAEWVKAFATKTVQAAQDYALAHSMPVDAPGAGVERWRPMVLQALDMVGQPRAFADITLRRMQQESGGNPNAVNRTDSNWIAGHPSVGLMQLIQGTYNAFKDPRRNVGPYLYGVSVDPLSNTLASMRYALGPRYGSLPAAYNRPGGYDLGGWIPPGYSTVWNGTGRPEPVLTDQQWRDISAAARGGDGAGTVIYNIHESTNAASVAAEVERSRRFRARIGATV